MDQDWERTRPYVDLTSDQMNQLLISAGIYHRLLKFELIRSGLRNTNYRIQLDHGKSLLLRIYSSNDDWWQKEKAIDQQLSREIKRPCLIEMNDACEICPYPYAFFDYIHGRRLDQGHYGVHVYEKIGRQLALLHRSKHFTEVGFLDKELKINAFLPPLSEWFSLFLDDSVERKLGLVLSKDLKKFLLEKDELIHQIDQSIVFVHNDFRPINILVDENEDAFFIDWEGAMAGHVYGDIGQFLRFASQVNPINEAAFISSYNQAALIPLDHDYQSKGQIRDLVNCLQLLKGEDQPVKDVDLIERIQKTIAFSV